MDDDELDALLRGEAAEATPSSESREPAPRRRAVVVTCALVLAVGLGAGAVGLSLSRDEASPHGDAGDASFIAQDIEQPPPDGSEAIAGSDWVDIGASDFELYLATLYPTDLPFPDGYTEEKVVARVAELNSGREGRAQEASFRFAYEAAAYCGWVDNWLAADRTGDRTALAQATEVMTAAIDWPMHNALDGGGVIDLMRESADAARAGDRAGVQYAADVSECAVWQIDARD